MKKFKLLIVATIVTSLLTEAFLVHAAIHRTSSFVRGSTPITKPNGVAPYPSFVLSFQFGMTNYYTNQTTTNGLGGPIATNGWIYYQLISGILPSPIVGNITSLTLANNGFIDPLLWLVQTNVVTQTNGGISTNTPGSVTNTVYVQLVTGSTNANGVPIVAPLSDIPLYADLNGQVTTNLNLILRLNLDSTNQAGAGTNTNPTITFDFARVNSKYNIVDTNNLFSVSLQANGTNSVSLMTNLSALINTGCDNLRFWDLRCPTNLAGTNFAGTNIYVQVAAVEGFAP